MTGNKQLISIFFCFAGSLLLIGCAGTPPEQTVSEPTSDTDKEQKQIKLEKFKYPSRNYNPVLKNRDREIQRLIQDNYASNSTLRKKLHDRTDVINYIVNLHGSEISTKVTGNVSTLTEELTREGADLKSKLGKWYHLRGSPSTPSSIDPFREKLDSKQLVHEFPLVNPAEFDGTKKSAFYLIITPMKVRKHLAGKKIIELDGLLWDFWDLSDQENGRFENTPQKYLPVFIAKNYRVVSDW